jgi:thiol-disulfide isomerase/thioredoxin
MRSAKAIARKTIAGLVLVVGLLGALSPALAQSGESVRLDPQRRAALAALPLLSGPPPGGTELQDRIVVLAFFASWCPPCHPEFEHLKEIDRRYREAGVSVVAVNIFEDYLGAGDRTRLAGFLAGKAADFTVLGEGEAIAPLFGEVDRIPTVFVFGRDGQAFLHFVHARGASRTHASLEELEAAVRAAL